MSWVSLLFSALIMHIWEDDGKVEDITLDKFETANRKHYWIFSAQDCSKRIILALKMLFSTQALLKSRGAYVDTQNCLECIIGITFMFLSSRRPENILDHRIWRMGEENDFLGAEPAKVESAKPTWPTFSNVRLDFTIAFLLSS